MLSRLTSEADISASLIYYVVDGVAAYFENVKSVLAFSAEEISFSVKGGVIFLRGESLVIKSVDGGDVVVGGKLNSVEKKSL